MFKWVQKAGSIGAAALMFVGLSGATSNVAFGSDAGLAVSEIEAHELTDLEVAYQVLEFRQDVFSAQQEKVGVLAAALDQALDHYADGSTDGLRGDVPLLAQRVTQSFRAFDRAQDRLQSLELEVGNVEYAIEILAFFAD
ncbi:MAG: hypothetical protein ACPG40_04655 [Alphaproteobacteria bacterium]